MLSDALYISIFVNRLNYMHCIDMMPSNIVNAWMEKCMYIYREIYVGQSPKMYSSPCSIVSDVTVVNSKIN
jgi:hypothetical protein